ncbi:MAG: 1-acyl-sn-glycerol-3-phosphate acyltransferase [Actinomycetota bacterium]
MRDAQVIRIDEHERRIAPRSERERCRATTSSGRPCRNYAVEDGYCAVHASMGATRKSHPSSRARPESATRIEEPHSGIGELVRTRLEGRYSVDDLGYDRQLSRDLLLPLFRLIYERYFRVRTLGIDRVPNEGPALVIPNHSGAVALDSLVLQAALALEHPNKRPLRNVGADLVFRLPFVGPMARKIGTVLACDEDTFELLRRGELVGVFPEGFKGVGKGWRDRYKLQRFGRGGFIEVALRARVPIIPVAIVGAEEAYPMIADIKPLARLIGAPYFPVTPTFPLLGPFGAIPLPSRWVIEFGDPIPMDGYPEDAADDKMLVFELADEIRDRIQQMIYRNLKLRGPAFF